MQKSESIFDILKSDHQMVKRNFEQIIKNRDTALYSQTLTALVAHMNGEETLLYPKVQANANTRSWGFKLYEQHNAGKAFVGTIPSTTADDKWVAQIEVLWDMLSYHIDFEETKIFPAAMKFINEKEATEIGRQYNARNQIPMTAPM